MAGIWLAARFTEAAFPETGAAQRGSDLVVMLTNACFFSQDEREDSSKNVLFFAAVSL